MPILFDTLQKFLIMVQNNVILDVHWRVYFDVKLKIISQSNLFVKEKVWHNGAQWCTISQWNHGQNKVHFMFVPISLFLKNTLIN